VTERFNLLWLCFLLLTALPSPLRTSNNKRKKMVNTIKSLCCLILLVSHIKIQLHLYLIVGGASLKTKCSLWSTTVCISLIRGKCCPYFSMKKITKTMEKEDENEFIWTIRWLRVKRNPFFLTWDPWHLLRGQLSNLICGPRVYHDSLL